MPEDTAISEGVPHKIQKLFCVNEFRRRLRDNEGYIIHLKEFLSIANTSTDQDVVKEYLEANGSVQEIMLVLDETAKSDLATGLIVFKALLKLFQKINADEGLKDQVVSAKDGAKLLLNSFSITIQNMLALNSGQHRNVTLNLLQQMLTLDKSLSRDVLSSTNVLDLPGLTQSGPLKAFLGFVETLLLSCDAHVISLVVQKGILTQIFDNLQSDRKQQVLSFLDCLTMSVLNNLAIKKTTKLKLFNTQVVTKLLGVYTWTGPQGTTKKPVNVEDRQAVCDRLTEFLVLLCCDKKKGIMFWDPSVGTSSASCNQLLLTVLEAIGVPWVPPVPPQLSLNILISCPDLVAPTFDRLAKHLEPRDSESWMKASEWVQQVLSVHPEVVIPGVDDSLSVQKLAQIVRSICSPLSVVRCCVKGLTDVHPWKVRHHCCRMLHVMYTSVQRCCEYLHTMVPANQRTRFHTLCLQHLKMLPSVETLLALWRQAVNSDDDTVRSVVPDLVKVVVVKTACVGHLDSTESVNSLVHELLASLSVSHQDDLTTTRRALIGLVDHSTLSPDKPLFEEALVILLSNNSESHSACEFLLASGVLDANRDEVYAWVHAISTGDANTLARFLVAVVLSNHKRSLDICSHHSDTDSRASDYRSLLKELMTLNLVEDDEQDCNTHAPVAVPLGSLLSAACAAIELPEWHSSKKLVKKYLNTVVPHLVYTGVGSSLVETCSLNRSIMSTETCAFVDRSRTEPCATATDTEQAVYRYLVNATETLPSDLLTSTSIIESYLLFQMVLFYLSENLDGWSRHAECLKGILRHRSLDLRVWCLEAVFTSPTLFDGFKPFDKKSTATSLVLSAMSEACQTLPGLELSLGPWKARFIQALVKSLRSRKHIEKCEVLPLLQVLHFSQVHVEQILREFVNVDDMSIFVLKEESRLSKWCGLLVAFYKMYKSSDMELESSVKAVLLNILKHASEQQDSELDVTAVDACLETKLVLPHIQQGTPIQKELLVAVFCRTSINHNGARVGRFLVWLNQDEVIAYLNQVGDAASPAMVLLAFEDAADTAALPLVKKYLKKCKNDILSAVRSKKKTKKWVLENIESVKKIIIKYLGIKVVENIKLKSNFNVELLNEVVKKLRTRSEGGVVKDWLNLVLTQIGAGNDSDWPGYSELVSNMMLVKRADWSSLDDQVVWPELAKVCLRSGFRIGDNHPVKLLTQLVRAMCPVSTKREFIRPLFELTTSHSEFFPSVLRASPLRDALLELMVCLVERDSTLMVAEHVPLLLSAYSAGFSVSDTLITQLLQLYEKGGVDIRRYEPFLWGPSAVSHYSVRSASDSSLSLWQQHNMMQVLNCLDRERMDKTLTSFPSLSSKKHDPETYDPAFLLPLFCNLLTPGAVVYSLQFIYKGCLSFCLAALSSRSKDVRLTASVALARLYDYLNLQPHMKQKPVWLHLLDCIRFSTKDVSKSPISRITSTFLARLADVLAEPLSPLYTAHTNFILSKSYIDTAVVPEFLPLFHSSDVLKKEHQMWILRVLRDGVEFEEGLDRVMRKKPLKIILSYYQSTLADVDCQVLIIQVLTNMLKSQKSSRLVIDYVLINWAVTNSAKLKSSTSSHLVDAWCVFLLQLNRLNLTKNTRSLLLSCFISLHSAVNNAETQVLLKYLENVKIIVALNVKSNDPVLTHTLGFLDTASREELEKIYADIPNILEHLKAICLKE